MHPTRVRKSGELDQMLDVDGARPIDAFTQQCERSSAVRSVGRNNLCCAACGIGLAVLRRGGRA